MNYYNEYDAGAAAWLRELISQNLIPYGHVDTRSITEVKPDDIKGYTQCHFFCGIAGWPLALQLAGWPANKPVWTGSCPCQPFSVAGRGKGVEDERHLWPEFRRLIAACKPATVFGEQVASKAGREWLSGVFLDLQLMPVWEVVYENMHCLRKAETNVKFQEILREIIRRKAASLQTLSTNLRERMEDEKRETTDRKSEKEKALGCGIPNELQRCASRGNSSSGSNPSGEAEGTPVRPINDGHGHYTQGEPRGMRIDRSSAEHAELKNQMGLTILGQDHSEFGVHSEKPACDLLCPELGVRKLGGSSDSESSNGMAKTKNYLDEQNITTEVEHWVTSKAGRDWLAGVFADLEGMGYSRAGADLCAAGVGAPHIRQRLFWVADSKSAGTWKNQRGIRGMLGGCCSTGGVADSVGIRCNERRQSEKTEVQRECSIGAGEYTRSEYFGELSRGIEGLGSCPSFWEGTNVCCRDGKTRRIPIEPALFPLADGLPGRVGLLRGAGNAIVPQVAAEFIAAFLDCQGAQPEQTEEWV